jgi:kinesin family protein 15
MVEVCAAVHEMEKLIAQGAACRRVGHTEMNRESSRSHSVLICTVESRTTDEHGLINTLRARLNMVDLAGGRTIPSARAPILVTFRAARGCVGNQAGK